MSRAINETKLENARVSRLMAKRVKLGEHTTKCDYCGAETISFWSPVRHAYMCRNCYDIHVWQHYDPDIEADPEDDNNEN